MKSDSEIIREVKALCIAGKYNEAIAATNLMQDKIAAIKAHLLCIEHEQATLKQQRVCR